MIDIANASVKSSQLAKHLKTMHLGQLIIWGGGGLVVRIKKYWGDFPGGTVVKNPPANARDTGSNRGPGRFLQAAEQLSPCATTTEALAPVLCNERPPQ